jgi:CubicO group peptidase (beta-lactamase class C family)
MSPTLKYALVLSIAGATTGALATGVPNAETLSARVDAVVRKQMRDQMIPGVSLAVVRNGRIIKAKGYGFANLEVGAPTKSETIFQAGSITKQFTAASVLLLVEQGRIGLDDSITKYFPEAPAAWKAITIRHLLTHTAGIPDLYGDTEQTVYSKGIIDFHRDYSEDEFARAYLALPLEFLPGDKWNYCSTGYQLLGFMIHRITGKFYADFLRERVFEPLGMKATRAFSRADVISNRVSGYELVSGAWKNTEWMPVSIMTTADGGLLSNGPDLARWDAALYTDRILKRTSLEAMWTPVRLNSGKTFPYGFGWNFTNANGHRVIWHTGGGFGFFANISRYVDDRLTIIVMTNVDETHTDVLKVAASIASIYLPDTRGKNPTKDW